MSKVTIKADGMKAMINGARSPAVQLEIGDMVVSEMKKSLEGGVSPVRGERRLEPYTNPKKYPGDRKPRLPVNLYLSGDMLGALRAWISGGKLMVGITDSEQKAKAKAHNDGIAPQPRRHFIPTDKGDEFTVSIQRQIKNLYAKLLGDIIKKRR